MDRKVKNTYLRTCASTEDSDQPVHSRRLIRNFPVRILDSQGCKVSLSGQRRLIRLCGCAGKFESSLCDISEDTILRCGSYR